MRKQKGFSLIELLIVIAIILIIAAIAVPNLLRSKMAANEASAVGTVRSINNAEVLYSNTYPATGYAAAIANLGGASPCTPSLATGCIIDPNVAAGQSKSGYLFNANNDGSGPPAVGFTTHGTAVTFGTTGSRNFFSDQSFVIRYNLVAGAAAVTDSALQ